MLGEEMGFWPQEMLDLGINSQNLLLLLVYFKKWEF